MLGWTVFTDLTLGWTKKYPDLIRCFKSVLVYKYWTHKNKKNIGKQFNQKQTRLVSYILFSPLNCSLSVLFSSFSLKFLFQTCSFSFSFSFCFRFEPFCDVRTCYNYWLTHCWPAWPVHGYGQQQQEQQTKYKNIKKSRKTPKISKLPSH